MNKYFEINENKHNIRCKIYYNTLPEIKKVIVFYHGFAGHKDNKLAQRFAERVLTKYKGIAVITFNWPCHGDDVKKKMLLEDCNTYIEMVNDYITSQLKATEIYAYATSFGAYNILKYIKEKGNPFEKIALRCPAVNMYDVLMNAVMREGERDLIEKGKNAIVGFDRKIEINPQFIADIKAYDVQSLDYTDYMDEIIVIHGTKDEIVAINTVEKFADDNLIEFVPIEGADHRFSDLNQLELATKAILEFYGL